MKYILLSLAILLSACSPSHEINQESIDIAENICKNNDGLLRIDVYEVSASAVCKNNVRYSFTKPQERIHLLNDK